MFLGSALAFMIMRWRARGIWENSALPKSGIAGLPWMSIIAAIYSAFLVFNLYLFIKDALYGVNNWKSAVFMGILYVAGAHHLDHRVVDRASVRAWRSRPSPRRSRSSSD